MGKLTKMVRSSDIVSARRFLFRGEEPKMKQSFIDPDRGLPFSDSFVPSGTLVATCTVLTQFLVSHIQRVRALSEILSTVIQRVMVFVVAFFPAFAIKDYTRHRIGNSAASCTNSTGSSKARSFAIPNRAPVPLRQPLKVFQIDNGILALRQGNQSIGLVKRLKNNMALDLIGSAFVGHRSTSNGLLLSAAIV